MFVAKWLRLLVDAVGHYGTEIYVRINAVGHYGTEIYKAIFDLRCSRNLVEGQRGTAARIVTSLPGVLSLVLWVAVFGVSGGLSLTEKALKAPLGGSNLWELMYVCKLLCSLEGATRTRRSPSFRKECTD